MTGGLSCIPVSSSTPIDLHWGSPVLSITWSIRGGTAGKAGKASCTAELRVECRWRRVVKAGVEPCQERLIKVCKVCSAYLRDSNVPVHVKSAHPAFFGCLPTFPPPLHGGSIFKAEAQVAGAHRRHGLPTVIKGEGDADTPDRRFIIIIFLNLHLMRWYTVFLKLFKLYNLLIIKIYVKNENFLWL